MSIGHRIRELRLGSQMTQRELAAASGLAVAYLSRIENSKVTPGITTLNKIARALSIPMPTLFDLFTLEANDNCPVSLSGKCILDHRHSGRGSKPKKGIEAYSLEQLETLRLCNLVLHTGDKAMVRSLRTMIEGLLALANNKRGQSPTAPVSG